MMLHTLKIQNVFPSPVDPIWRYNILVRQRGVLRGFIRGGKNVVSKLQLWNFRNNYDKTIINVACIESVSMSYKSERTLVILLLAVITSKGSRAVWAESAEFRNHTLIIADDFNDVFDNSLNWTCQESFGSLSDSERWDFLHETNVQAFLHICIVKSQKKKKL